MPRHVTETGSHYINIDGYFHLSGDLSLSDGYLSLSTEGDPTSTSLDGYIYVKSDSGDSELFYMDNSGNVVQITKDDALLTDGYSGTILISNEDTQYFTIENGIITDVTIGEYAADIFGNDAYDFGDWFYADEHDDEEYIWMPLTQSGPHLMDLDVYGYTPSLRYVAHSECFDDSDALKPWWHYGEALTPTGSPVYSQRSPFVGELLGEKYGLLQTTDGYYMGTSTTEGNIGTDDLWIETIFRWDGGEGVIAAKRDGGVGWEVGVFWTRDISPTDSYCPYITIEDAGGSQTTWSDPLDANSFYHISMFINRDEEHYADEGAPGGYARYGSAIRINGKQTQAIAEKPFDAIQGSLNNSEPFCLGADSGGNSAFPGVINYFAMYHAADWWEGGTRGIQDTIAETRALQTMGVWPAYDGYAATTSSIPVAWARIDAAYIHNYDSDGYQNIYRMGKNWFRVEHRKDINGLDYYGYIAEDAHSFAPVDSEDLTTWDKNNCVISEDAVTWNPQRLNAGTMDAIKEDSGTSTHEIYYSYSATLNQRQQISCFAMPLGREWLQIDISGSSTNGDASFHLSGSGSVGTNTNGFGVRIEPCGGNLYRVYACFKATATETVTVSIRPCTADDTPSYEGDGIDAIAVWGINITPNKAPVGMETYRKTVDGVTLTTQYDRIVFGVDMKEQEGTMVFHILAHNMPTPQTTCSSLTLVDQDDLGNERIITQQVLGAYITRAVIASSAGGSESVYGPAATAYIDGEAHEWKTIWESGSAYYIVDSVAGVENVDAVAPAEIDALAFGTGAAAGEGRHLIWGVRIYKDYNH